MKIQRLLAPLVGAILLGLSVAPASAQCNGTPSANTVCAGPATGGAGQFRARAIVPADLPIGTAVQAWDADLDAIAGLTTAANKLQYWTGSHTAALIDFPSWARSVVSAASASAGRTAFGLTIGTDVQAYDAELAAIAGLTSANNKCFYWTGSGTAATYDCSSFGRGLINAADASAVRTAIGAVIGTDVQAFDSDLSAVAALSSNGLIARTGTGTVATRTVTAPAAGITVSNGDGVSGNPTLALANDLAALEGLSTTGLIARTATDAAATRSIAAGTGMSVSNGDGVSGNPTVSLANTSVAAGSYTSADITVDAQGRITSASNGAGGGGGISDTDRRNALLDRIYQSKVYAQARRGINSWATGFKGASDTLNGINAGSSSNYSVDNSAIGLVKPTFTAGSDQTATHTGYTASGNTASASSETSGFPAWKAFDKVTGGGSGTGTWVSNGTATGWLQYQFGSAKTIGSYTVRSGNGFATRAPSAWTLKGSNTGSFTGEEVTLDTRSGETSWTAGGQVRTYAVASPGSYTYYRLNITGNNGDSFLLIDEMTLSTSDLYNSMTLVTASQTADSSVSNGRVLLEYDNAANPTINTDLTVEVTANGGTNWTSATLSAVTSNSQDGRKVVETADTAVTSGTSFAARIKTFNSKNIPLYGATLTAH